MCSAYFNWCAVSKTKDTLSIVPYKLRLLLPASCWFSIENSKPTERRQCGSITKRRRRTLFFLFPSFLFFREEMCFGSEHFVYLLSARQRVVHFNSRNVVCQLFEDCWLIPGCTALKLANHQPSACF